MNNRTTNQSTGTSCCRYYMFHRQDMHKMLMDTATQEQGTGTPVKLVVNHKVHQNHNFLSPDPCTLFPPKLIC